MGTVPPRFDDKVDERLLEKKKAGRDLSDTSKDTVVEIYAYHSEKRRALREKYKQGAEITNTKRQAERAENYKIWQAYANDIRDWDRTLTKGAIYRRVASEFNVGERTVRRNIKLP